jgi:ElaB/YqjD/DUF883 family membrane-anchored ribosome-binding protein
MKHDGDRHPREIQADIARVRSDLDETLSAIEHRLTPGQLVDQGLDYLRHSGAREYVANLGASAKQDPLPLALTVVGLGWLMLSSRRDPAGHGVVTRPGPSADTLAESARDAAAGLSGAASSVRESAARTSEKISQTTRAARERAQQVGHAAREGADRIRSGVDRLVHEQPLALGAIGIAVGAILAASAPRTRQEDRLMGVASDRLKDSAKEGSERLLDEATAGQGDGRGSAVVAAVAEAASNRPSTSVAQEPPIRSA